MSFVLLEGKARNLPLTYTASIQVGSSYARKASVLFNVSHFCPGLMLGRSETTLIVETHNFLLSGGRTSFAHQY
jgi:hypothetical protein